MADLRIAAIAGIVLITACSSLPGLTAPAFPRLKPLPPGEERILLLAGVGGYLTQRGRCLGLSPRKGAEFSTLIWPDTARLKLDGRGYYVEERGTGTVARLGDWLSGGGGMAPYEMAEELETQLTEPVPLECRGRMFSLNPGFKAGSAPGGS